MVLTSLAPYRGPLRPHNSPRRAAHRPALHSPRAAHCACLRLRRRSRRLTSKVRCRWGYPLQCPPCPKLRPTADRRARAPPQAANDILTLTSFLRLLAARDGDTGGVAQVGQNQAPAGTRASPTQHGGKGWRRRVGEPRHHHCRHRIRRCSQTPHRRRTGQDVRAGDGRAHRQARMLGLYGVDLGYATSPTAVPLHDLGINFRHMSQRRGPRAHANAGPTPRSFDTKA